MCPPRHLSTLSGTEVPRHVYVFCFGTGKGQQQRGAGRSASDKMSTGREYRSTPHLFLHTLTEND